MRDGRSLTVEVTSDGAGLVSHAGSALLGQVASDKERAAGNYKHGSGFHPLGAYTDETREALAIMLRAGNAGSNTAADHVTVIDRSLAQIPDAQRSSQPPSRRGSPRLIPTTASAPTARWSS
jgi:hypothetical protein